MIPASVLSRNPGTFQIAAPRDELETRLDKVLARMQVDGIDCAVFTTPQSIYYLTGIELGGAAYTQQALVLTPSGKHRFLLRELELAWRDVWAHQSWATEWAVYSDDEDPADLIARLVKDVNGSVVKRLGMETSRTSISYENIHRIAAATGAEEVAPIHHFVESLRAVKSETEIQHMRAAGAITSVGTEAAADALRGGASDAEAHTAAYTAMSHAGSGPIATAPIIGVGQASTLAHAPWLHLVPEPGEVVTTMMSASVHRYQCPVERSYSVGEPDERLAEIFETCVQATEQVLREVRPGMTSEQADQIARDVHKEAGFADAFNNRLGYSIGIGFEPLWWENEVMQLRPHDARPIEVGMTFHLVPGIQIPGIGLVIRSLPVVMTASGFEPLLDVPLRVEHV